MVLPKNLSPIMFDIIIERNQLVKKTFKGNAENFYNFWRKMSSCLFVVCDLGKSNLSVN